MYMLIWSMYAVHVSQTISLWFAVLCVRWALWLWNQNRKKELERDLEIFRQIFFCTSWACVHCQFFFRCAECYFSHSHLDSCGSSQLLLLLSLFFFVFFAFSYALFLDHPSIPFLKIMHLASSYLHFSLYWRYFFYGFQGTMFNRINKTDFFPLSIL